LAQICTESFVGWGSAPDPTGGAYSVPPDDLAGLGAGATRGRGTREGNEDGRGRERKGGKGKGGEGRGKEEKGEDWMREEAGHPEIFRWIDAFG